MSYEMILALHVLVMGYWIGSNLVVNSRSRYVLIKARPRTSRPW
jgi:hypothetical protein